MSMRGEGSRRMADCGRGRSRSALLVGTALTGALCAFVAASPAGAATTSWIDATGDWLNPANWSLGIPNFGLDATVSNGGTAQINGPATANTLTIGGNSAVDLQ